MEKERALIIGMAVVIVVLLVIVLAPNVTNPIKTKYRTEGYNACILQVMNTMVNDLRAQGFTELRLGEETVRLVAVPAETTQGTQ